MPLCSTTNPTVTYLQPPEPWQRQAERSPDSKRACIAVKQGTERLMKIYVMGSYDSPPLEAKLYSKAVPSAVQTLKFHAGHTQLTSVRQKSPLCYQLRLSRYFAATLVRCPSANVLIEGAR